ncbi:Uncharacterized protein FWK35_00036550, partial [Aphis craccivora]
TEGNIVHENENEIEDINVIDSPGSAEGQETVALPTNATKITPTHNKQKLSAFQENLLNAIEKNRIQTKQEEFDENKHFLLSLLPSMRKMDTEKNFQFRIEIMECMKKYMTPASQPQAAHLAPVAPSIIPQSERPYYQVPSELYSFPYQYQNAISPPQLDISSRNLQSNYLNISSSSTTQNDPNTKYSLE